MRRRMRNPRKLEELCFLASLRKESVVFYTEERPSWCTLNNVTRLLYTTRRLSFCNNINRDTYVISVTSGLQIRNIIRITGASNACLTADYECTPIQSSPPPPLHWYYNSWMFRMSQVYLTCRIPNRGSARWNYRESRSPA